MLGSEPAKASQRSVSQRDQQQPGLWVRQCKASLEETAITSTVLGKVN